MKVKPGDIIYVLLGAFPHIVKFKTAEQKSEAKVSESTKSSSVHNGKNKNDKKRSSTSEYDQDAKKRRISKEEHANVKSVKTNDSEEDEHMKSVAEKLKMLKDSAKSDKTEDDTKSKQKVSPKVKEELVKKSDSSSKKECRPATESSWTQHEKLYIYTAKGVQSSDKENAYKSPKEDVYSIDLKPLQIASFDIDGTIITTQSGKVFPTHPGDWKIMIPEIFGKLKKLRASGFKIVFFTNQLGVQRGKTKIDDFKQKFTYILEKLGVPVQIFIATGSGIFRKPSTGMWKYMTKKFNDGIRVNMTDSFYCGDAAGRPEKWAPKRKKDFSCSDRLFALNIGLKFYTPEEYFSNQKPAPFNLPAFDPRKLSATAEIASPSGSSLMSTSQEVVVLAGYPASGKSFFAKKYLVPKGYVHVNRDTLGTWQKCVASCKKSLGEGKSVVIDNTNPDVESRARYIECAKNASVPCRCFVFTDNIGHIKHNERFREMTDKSHKPINEMILNSFKSKYKIPEKVEGFTELLKINFVPKFDSTANEDLYRQFLIEK